MATGRGRPTLPAAVGDLVGRDDLVRETVQRVLGVDRLVTLVGPGGVGKTALALEVARRCRDQHDATSTCLSRDADDQYVAVAYLGHITRPDELHREIIRAVGITDQSSDDPVDVLVEHLRGQDKLLVLDNCEQLWEAVGDLCAVLLDEAPEVRVLATSRHHLGIAGEHATMVPPLSVRSEGSSAQPSDAMRLLLRRAEAAGRVVEEDDDLEALGELVDWSSGLPLVLELIAVRLGGGMSPREVLTRLDGGRLLATRTRRVRSHHRTLEQTLDWSHGLCSPEQQRLLARISVFAGGFTLDTAERVCSGNGISEQDVVDLLADLVRQSLVVAGPNGRYHQLQPVREYGQRQLRALDEELWVRDAHCAFFRDLAAELASTWYGEDEVALLRRAHVEMPNFRAALHHCATTPGLAEIGLGMVRDLARLRVQFFFALLGEFTTWFQTLLDRAPVRPTPERIGSVALLGWIKLCQGAPREVAVHLEHCRELVAMLGEDAQVAPLYFLEGAHALLAVGDPGSVEPLRRLVELFGQMGPESCGDCASAKLLWALAAGFYGDEATAIEAAEDCLNDARQAGAEWAISWALWARGMAPLRHGAPEEAVAWFRAGLEIQVRLQEQWGSTWASEAIAWALAAVAWDKAAGEDLLEIAAELLGGAVAMQKATGAAIAGLIPFGRERDKARDAIVARLGHERYHRAYGRGTALPSREAVYALALGPRVEAGGRRAPDSGWDQLSGRQREIAVLVSQGLTNQAIAQKLHLSVSTIENHLTALFAKIGVANRAELSTWVGAQSALRKEC
jgi:non-specific serine/threonine protein kinase